MKATVLSWSWRGDLTVEDLTEALAAVDRWVYPVSDGGDDYLVVIADQPLDEQQVQQAYQASVRTA